MGPETMGWGMGWGWGWLMMIPFWALVILGIVALVKWIGAHDETRTRSTESPLEILRKRYARGEMTQEDFKRMKQDVVERG